MPTVDIEPRGNLNMCSYDIFDDSDGKLEENCSKAIEYTPVKVDPEKLKAYFVPYIEMTHEKITEKEESQLKVRY